MPELSQKKAYDDVIFLGGSALREVLIAVNTLWGVKLKVTP
jgi:hypothetical protein